MDDLLGLPFDQYQRYKLVADLVERVRPGKRPLRILDVGGRTALLRKFLPDDRVELVDVEVSNERDLVLGSGGALPFLDGSFDVVAAFDTLEHVPPEFREDFVRECARVAGRHVILAGPYRTPEVDEAEEILVGFMDDKLGVKHRYLAEHREYGLPVRAQTEQWLGDAGGRVMSVGHANLDRWLVLMCLELYLDNDPLLRDLAQRFFAFYNRSMYSSDHGGAVYRHAVVASLGNSREPSVKNLFDGPSAPKGATQALLAMGLEVIAFDGEKDAWKPEIKRLEKVIRGLEKNLTGHQKRLADTTDDLSEHRATLEDERAQRTKESREQASIVKGQAKDLAGHQKRLTDTIEDLREHKLTLVAERAQRTKEAREHASIVKGQAKDLAGHQKRLTDTTEDLSEHKLTLAAERAQRTQESREQSSIIKSQAKDLVSHKKVLAKLELELAAQTKVSKELSADLAGHQAHLTELKSDIETQKKMVLNLRAGLQESEQVRAREAAAGAQVVKDQAAEIAARGELVKELELSLAENQKQNRNLGELLSDERVLHEELTQNLGQQLKDLASDRDAVLLTLTEVQQHRTEVLDLLQETQTGAEALEAALHASQAEVARQREEAARQREVEAGQRAEIERLRLLVRNRLEAFKLVFKPERPEV